MDEQTTAFLKNYGLIILLGITGLASLVFGIIKMNTTDTPVVISENSSVSEDASVILVDVAGAVVRPGVYSLPASSRISDAIEKAGGITEEADTVHIAQVINKAQVLQDGQKVFIPLAQTDPAVESFDAQSNLININTASARELEDLPGIGEVTADKIISNRPYTSLEELVSKKAVSQSVFEKIKEQISLY